MAYKATDIQKALNNKGYKLDVDGVIGPKTTAAIKDYQQKNGLAVDGIVGDKTWAALNKESNTSTQTQTQAQTPTTTETKTPAFQYEAYKPSDAVTQAEALLQQQLAQKPGEYQSTWQDQLNATLQQILNREKFSYDLNGDMLYQQYKDQYTTQGKLAMMDAMGQAAAMSGGYGNSYAQTAGQQAYQGYLQQLNNMVPELYQLALDQYNAEGDSMYKNATLMAQMEDQEYSRYRDTVSDYYTNLGLARDEARYQAEQDYSKWVDGRDFSYGQYSDDRAYTYQTERDQVADEQWQKTFDEGVRQYNEQSKKSSGGSVGGSDPDDTGDTVYDDDGGGVSKRVIQDMQRTLGVTADGVWGPESKAAAGGLSAKEAYAKWNKGQLTGASPINEGSIKSFMSKLHPESQHDAVMRAMYGSYRQYVAEQIEKSSLSDAEKAYLVTQYGITESDLDYKKH